MIGTRRRPWAAPRRAMSDDRLEVGCGGGLPVCFWRLAACPPPAGCSNVVWVEDTIIPHVRACRHQRAPRQPTGGAWSHRAAAGGWRHAHAKRSASAHGRPPSAAMMATRFLPCLPEVLRHHERRCPPLVRHPPPAPPPPRLRWRPCARRRPPALLAGAKSALNFLSAVRDPALARLSQRK